MVRYGGGTRGGGRRGGGGESRITFVRTKTISQVGHFGGGWLFFVG